MIDQATIAKILDVADIYDVVSEQVALHKRGANYIGLCPFHNEKTPSFVVSPAKGMFKCFGCGKGGNAVHFIMEYEHVSYYDALRELARRYRIEIKEKELTPEQMLARNERESLFVVNEFAKDFFVRTLHEHPDGKALGLPYFRKRGFRDDIIRKFQLGYSPDEWSALADEALAKGYKKEFLVKTGLCIEREGRDGLIDRFRGRVIFPVHNTSGKIVAFGGRIMNTDAKTAKYLNSPESEIYHKSNELYGIYLAKQAIVRQDKCFLVEGYTDVIQMHQAGVENVVASSGTSLTPGQIRLIHRFTGNITVIYDGDFAGIKASLRGIDMLLEEGMNIKVVLLPDGEDPDSFAGSRSSSEFQSFIKENETDFIHFKVKILSKDAGEDPVKRAELIASIVKSISVIPDAILRSVYANECGKLLNVDERLLNKEIAKLLAEKDKAGVHEDKNDARADAQDGQGENDITAEDAGKEDRFKDIERLIAQIIVRYGNRVMCYVKDENGGDNIPLGVMDFIKSEMEEDDLQFRTPLYKAIYDNAIAHYRDEDWDCRRFFMTHSDEAVSREAALLMTDRYVLSKYHARSQKVFSEEERLYEIVPQLVTDFKNCVVEDELKNIESALKREDVCADPEKCLSLMNRFKELKEVQKILAKKLGDRVITV